MRPLPWAMALCALATSVQAAPLARLAIEDIAHLADPTVSELSFDQGAVMGTFQSPTRPAEIVRISSGRIKPLLPARVASASSDGRWLLYLSGRNWVLRDQRTGVERRQPLKSPPEIVLSAPVWSPDSRFVAAHFSFAASAPHPIATPTLSHGARVEVIDGTAEAIHKRASAAFDPHLLIWEVTTPRPRINVIDATETYPGAWSGGGPGGHTYYFALGQHPYGGQTPFTAVRALAAETSQSKTVARISGYNQGLRPKLSPDGRFLAFAADLDAKAFGVANNVVLADLKTGAVRPLTHDLAASSVLWGADGRIYFLARDGGFQQLQSVDLHGRRRVLAHDDQYRAGAVESPGGDLIAYTTVDGYGRKTVRIWSVLQGREQILTVTADPGARFQLGRFRQVTWRTPDGLALKGFVVTPPGCDPRRRYPLFVDVHGGGPGSRLYLWSVLGYPSLTPLEWQLWASLGYVVFVPDYRSSGEYGAAVNTKRTRRGERNGDLGGIVQDAQDVESGVRWMLRRRDVDPARIAIFGQSAGGARVNYLLTRTRLFAAAILHDPIESGRVAEDLEDARLALPITWFGASPGPIERRAQLTGFLFDGWRSSTPTLIMVGNVEHGALSPLSAETLYAMLQSVHVPTRFVRFLDDGHNAASPQGVQARFAEMKAWLDRFAPGRPRKALAKSPIGVRR